MIRRILFSLLPIFAAGLFSTENSAVAQSNIDAQANREARVFWNARITQCGSEYYTRDRNYVHQFRSPRIDLRARSVSTADRLNGIEYVGFTNFHAAQSRTYSRTRTLYNDVGWGRWSEGFTMSLGGVGLNAEVRKEHGRWTVTPSSISQAGVLKPVDCSNITGFTASSFVDDQRVSWVPMSVGRRLPLDAIAGGVELGGENNSVTLYVCRVNHNGLQPGKLLNGGCFVPYGGKEVIFSNYQVATGDGIWGRARANYSGALVGGWETERKLVVCRAHYVADGVDHGQHPGKVVNGLCSFGFGGRELGSRDFEVFYPK